MAASQKDQSRLRRLGSVRSLAAFSSLLLAPVDASALQYGRLPLEPSLVGITVTGPIVPGDFDRLGAFIQTLSQSDHILSFFIDSPGGNIVEAEKIAAYIHETEAAVTIPSGSQCSSACFLLFAAAARRFMASDALIGVHSASDNGEESLTTMGFTTVFAREAAAYGVPPAIIGKMVQTEPGRMAWLAPSDLQPMGVVILTPSSTQARPLPEPSLTPTPRTAPPSFKYKGANQAEFEDRERHCLATAIYFEARDGPVRRQVGVGQVIMNRVRSPQFPETICGVVYQDQMSPNCQFPFTCDGRSDTPQEDDQWALAQDIARKITAGELWLPELGYATSLEDALAIGDPALLAKRHPPQSPPSPEPSHGEE